MDMAYFSNLVIVVGVSMFGILMAIYWLEEKIPSMKQSKFIMWINQVAMTVMLLCVPVFVVSLMIESSNAPSGYEVCMQGMENATDPLAISYMEDYCYELYSG